MADTITDGRTNVDDAESATPYDDLGGTGAGTLDNEIFIENANSMGEILSDTLNGLLFDNGTAVDWSDSHFYVWINCGIVGLLATIANGGMRIRFCGDTVTDFFEVYVGGKDSWPASINGGWTQFVVDIEAASAAPDNSGGTPPATTAIRYVGWAGITDGTMPRHANNTWMDEIARLPDGTPGIIIQGRNGGTVDWTFDDIVTQLQVGTAFAGTFIDGPGGSYLCNTSIQWGVNDTVTHAFTDTNAIILLEDQIWIAADLYNFSALGNSGGTTNVTIGVKTGSGNAATGAQGVIISAASTGVRFDMDFNDPDLDGINFYGCTLIHGGDFLLDDVAVSFISTTFLDCTSALVSNSEMLRVSVIDANTADGVAFMTTDDISDIVNSTFEFSDGHAIELTTPRVATQASIGNIWTGYGLDASNDAAVFNNTAGAVTINVTLSPAQPTTRDGASASTTVNTSVTLTVTVKDEAGAVIVGAQVAVVQDSDGTIHMNENTDGSGIATETVNLGGGTGVSVRVRLNSVGGTNYFPVTSPQTTTADGLDITVTLIEDLISSN